MPKKYDDSPAAKARRQRVIDRLEKQLVLKYKPVYDKETGKVSTVPLDNADTQRIKNEIEILKTRL